jgi:peptide deformylase
MLETMDAAGAVGLAAPQVGKLVNLIVLDVRTSRRSSSLWIDGQVASLDAVLPLALVNVEVRPGKEVEVAPERCNSVPGIRVDIERPESVEVWGWTRMDDRSTFDVVDFSRGRYSTSMIISTAFCSRIACRRKC